MLEGRLVDEKETRKVIQERNQVCTVISVRLLDFVDAGS